MHVLVYVNMLVPIRFYTYVQNVCLYIRMYKYIHSYMHTGIHVYRPTYIHIYIQYTHTHTYLLLFQSQTIASYASLGRTTGMTIARPQLGGLGWHGWPELSA